MDGIFFGKMCGINLQESCVVFLKQCCKLIFGNGFVVLLSFFFYQLVIAIYNFGGGEWFLPTPLIFVVSR